MSCKNVTRASLPHDRYYTPRWVVRQCCDHVLPALKLEVGSILEPSAGVGSFVRELRDRYPGACLHANDIDPYRYPEATKTFCGDFLAFEPTARYDVVVGNPPYTRALEFVRHALGLGTAVVFLLRQGFLSSARRNDFFRTRPPLHIFQLAHRPSFTQDRRTDAADYCFCCWDQRRTASSTRLHWLPTVPRELRT